MALALSQAGAEVVMVGRNEAALAEAMEQIKAEGGCRGASIAADLLDRSTLGDVVAEASEVFGAPDILINAAGINLREPWNEISEDSWQQTLDINLSTPFFLARHCIPGMKNKGRGNIINVASLQSFRAFANSIVVEEAQLDALGILGEDRKVRAGAVPPCSLGICNSWPDHRRQDDAFGR